MATLTDFSRASSLAGTSDDDHEVLDTALGATFPPFTRARHGAVQDSPQPQLNTTSASMPTTTTKRASASTSTLSHPRTTTATESEWPEPTMRVDDLINSLLALIPTTPTTTATTSAATHTRHPVSTATDPAPATMLQSIPPFSPKPHRSQTTPPYAYQYTSPPATRLTSPRLSSTPSLLQPQRPVVKVSHSSKSHSNKGTSTEGQGSRSSPMPAVAPSVGVRSLIGERRTGSGQGLPSRLASKAKSLKKNNVTPSKEMGKKKHTSAKTGRLQEPSISNSRPQPSRMGLGLAAARLSLNPSKRRESRKLARPSDALATVLATAPTASVLSTRLVKMVKTKSREPARACLEVRLRVHC
jgi:hypothetical protein